MDKILKKIKTLPETSGVYLHYDANGNVIYIGKAKNLKNRVSTYFKKLNTDRKTEVLVSNISDFSFIKTKTESEALLLEKELVSLYLPKYNVLLRDDKRFPYIKIDTEVQFPEITKERKVSKKGRYFGPYASNYAVNETIELLNKIFSLKRCAKTSFSKNHKPCLNYHIDSCMGYCVNKNLKENYEEKIKKIINFLSKKDKNIIEELERKMKIASNELKFERAKELKEAINILEAINEKNRKIKYILKSGLKELKEKVLLENRLCQKIAKFANLKIKYSTDKLRFESYDISHTNGVEIVGSEVVFYGVDKAKSEYRKYKIKRFEKSDIYCLEEVLSRRLRNLKANKPNFNISPDVIFVDGGIEQVKIAIKVLKDYKLKNIKVLGMIKDDKHKTRGLVYQKGNEFKEYNLKEDLELFKFISTIQNETHRFAITFHKKRLSKKVYK